jgi:hypothetical protein
MIAAAAGALVAAVTERLATDPGLAALVDGRVFETPPRNVPYPYVVVDAVGSDDRSGVDAALARHRLEIRAYARDGGKRAALAAAAAAEAALAAPLPLAGHRPVLVQVRAGEARLLKDRLTAEALVSVIALTEPE